MFFTPKTERKNYLVQMIVHSKGSLREKTLSSPIYRQYQGNNASEKTLFHKQNIPESPQEQSTNRSNRAQSKIIAQI